MPWVRTKWMSMLDLEDIFMELLPYQLNVGHPNRTENEAKAYQFVCMLNMVDKIHEWLAGKHFAMYESNVQMHSTSQFAQATSIRSYFSARQFAVTSHRRLFITRSGNLGLCPKATWTGDAVAFLYGCPVPTILRTYNILHASECRDYKEFLPYDDASDCTGDSDADSLFDNNHGTNTYTVRTRTPPLILVRWATGVTGDGIEMLRMWMVGGGEEALPEHMQVVMGIRILSRPELAHYATSARG
ncbi:hypothetical protein B0O99DRAFT_595819 [Bisporella sp. PMI_857]|nr:hypothetical protein B0O99DRAFT_595819 [Bisporella sp. PMI_857]